MLDLISADSSRLCTWMFVLQLMMGTDIQHLTYRQCSHQNVVSMKTTSVKIQSWVC